MAGASRMATSGHHAAGDGDGDGGGNGVGLSGGGVFMGEVAAYGSWVCRSKNDALSISGRAWDAIAERLIKWESRIEGSDDRCNGEC